MSHFKDLKDPRQQGKVAYPLEEILLLCLLAVLAGAETIVDTALFNCKKPGLLRRFPPFQNGTPAHDHLGDILAVLDAEQFQGCFVALVAALSGTPEVVIATDLSASLTCLGTRAGRAAKTETIWSGLLSPFLRPDRRTVLPSEIVAIPRCWTCGDRGRDRHHRRDGPPARAQKIVHKKAHYLLALKANKGSLREDVELFAVTGPAKHPALGPRHDLP